MTINTSFDVYVLGDAGTAQRMELLTEKAAERGAVITETFAFEPGEAARNDDLTDVEAIIEALGRAIATRTAIWLPWWHEDVAREEHLRRMSLTLQRHGLDLLVGPQLMPCPVDGGINQIDAALRSEVRAVFELDDAVMAAAGMRALGVEIEEALTEASRKPAAPAEPCFFSTAEAADLLGKSSEWVSRGLRRGAFVHADGSPVEPIRVGRTRRFTVPMLRAIAWSAFRRGTLSPQSLEEVLAELSRSER